MELEELIKRLATELADRLKTSQLDPFDISAYALSAEQIAELTRRKRPVDQMKVLKTMGIPAYRLHDNTIRVLRRDLEPPAVAAAITALNAPKLRL